MGPDRQADGGTHVASTGEVGRFEVTRTESKGKANARLRITLSDGQVARRGVAVPAGSRAPAGE